MGIEEDMKEGQAREADAARQAQVVAQQYFANPDDTVGKEYDGRLHRYGCAG